jgi:3-phenylpropionate/trans-cinnamate dioxygenase ferredoxin reductase component
LSKAYLRGEVGFAAAAVHDEGFYDEHAIELLTSTAVRRVDPVVKTVTLDPGGELDYDQLLLTTGAAPRRLSIPGADLSGIHYLRSLSSCDALRAALAVASRLVVVGGGWIGSEVAASARQLGKDVAMVEVAEVPLERVLGAEVGAMFGDLHRQNGVDLHLGLGVEAFRGHGRAEEVVLVDGSTVAGDLFVVGVGVVPRTELVVDADIELDNGIMVDKYLATSRPGIWAAGDVANAYHPVFGTHIRLEHWSAALNQGPTVAKNMLGQRTAYRKIPYFFSDQYDLGMEYSGFATQWDTIVYRGRRDDREVIVFWLDKEVVVAGMNVNVWDVTSDIAALVESRQPVGVARLADPGVALSDLV